MVRTDSTIVRRRTVVQIAVLALAFPLVLGAQQGHAHGEHGSHGKPADSAGKPVSTPAGRAPGTSGARASDSAAPKASPQGRATSASPAAVAREAASRDSDAVDASATAAMSGPIVVSPYMKLTPERPATPADSARAAAVVTELRKALEKYKDVKVAQADGYEIFAPRLPQEVYHFTSTWRSIKESFRFDPAQPSSLLYRKTPDGKFELVGAMYHAPKRLSLDKLDERVPLGIARWHAHTNFCVPKRRDRERWLETKNGRPVFGPPGGIATREQCDAVDGKFHEQVFGWMVHAMVFAGDDPATIWGGDHGKHGDHHR